MFVLGRSLVALALAVGVQESAIAQSNTVVGRAEGIVVASDCTETQSSSTVGQIAGGVGGGAIGGLLGGMVGSMFGRTGTRVGAALGATGGAVAGGKLATTSRYFCTLEVTAGEKNILVDADQERRPNIGERVRVLTMEDGAKRVMFER